MKWIFRPLKIKMRICQIHRLGQMISVLFERRNEK